MDIKELLTSFAQITVFAVMLSMGMALGFQGITRLWRHPSRLFRCVVAAFLLVPLAAMVVTSLLPLPSEVRIGIAAMAVIPGAPLIYRKMLKGPGDAELAGSFQATMALLSIVLVPLWFGILSSLYPNIATAPLATVFRQVMLVQGIPLLCGAALSQWFPELVEEFEPPLKRISSAMLVGVVLLVLVMGLNLVLKAGPLPVLAVALPKVLTAGLIPVIGAVLFATACLLAGHFLGGPEPESRLTIAVANGTRNAGLALALATAHFPDPGILGAIATYAVFSSVAGSIYSNLYQKKLAKQEVATA